MRIEDEGVDTLRRLQRDAADRLGEAPDVGVRAAVLAAAARGVAARPHLAGTTAAVASRRATHARHWPWSAAALLVVSVMTGLVATHAMRDAPERITTITTAEAPPAAPAAPAATAPADRTAAEAPPAAAATPPPRAIARREPHRDVARRAVDRTEERSDDTTPESAPPPSARAAFVAPPEVPPAPLAESLAKAAPASDASTRTMSGADTAPSLRATTAMRARVARAPEPDTPEAWVQRIVRLRIDGNDAEADRELDGLRRRHPDFPLPATVLRQAGTR